ncbi:ATP-dependent sacrificial sulfur transferase LarE [Nigerium massiliense]|uniref:ATP-dependent sacrificial sulfur transferase LarE n=1 Tax=Nigerium massiliense TaxID=1522317 RepID=UPI00058E5BD0|nr:ATP-dependent sacrificial sulfur transferase LarE [Nigerium massiliense]
MTTDVTFTDLTGTELDDARAIERALRGCGRLGVAFSGGVDSAVLLAVAVRALGPEQVVALLAVSPSLARDELAIARAVAAQAGARLIEFETFEGERADYRANGADRCYHCKTELFERIDDHIVAEQGLDAVAYGENADDAVAPDRPGARAATEHAVLRPLAEAGVTKDRVRALARALGLSVADKPAAPCLASRIPHGQAVTPEKLREIDEAEHALRVLGFSDARVRHHGDIARVEVPLAELSRFADDGVRQQALRAIKAAGFGHVTVDLAGLQSGLFTLQVVGKRG